MLYLFSFVCYVLVLFCIFSICLYVLVALVLIKYYDVGMIGLVIASVLSNFYGLILAPIQYKKLINQRAKGIWLQ